MLWKVPLSFRRKSRQNCVLSGHFGWYRVWRRDLGRVLHHPNRTERVVEMSKLNQMQLSLAACLKQHWTLKHSYPECHVAIVEWTCHDESQRMELSFDVFGDWGIDVIDHSLLLGFLGGQTPEDWFSSSNYYALLQPVIEMQRLEKTGKHTQRIPFGCFVVQVSWWTGMGCSECPYLRVTICFCMSTTAPTFHVFTCTLTSFVQDNSTSDGVSARVGHGSWRKAELRRFSRDWMCVWWENQGQGSRLYNYWLQWDVARANNTGVQDILDPEMAI